MLSKLSHKGIVFSLYFIAITFPLPYAISNLGIALLVLSWIVSRLTLKPKNEYNFFSWKNSIALGFIGLFLWQVISLLYTNDFSHGLKMIEYKLSLFVLPIVLWNIQLKQKQIISILKSYIISIFLVVSFLTTRSLWSYHFNDNLLVYKDFTSILQLHSIFLAYYIFLAILLVYHLFKEKLLLKRERILYGLSLVFFVFGLVLATSRNVIISMVLLSIVYIVYKGIANRVSLKETIIAVLTVLIIGVLSSRIQLVEERIDEIGSFYGTANIEKIKNGGVLDIDDRAKFNGTSLRLTMWYLGINELLEENRLLIGLSAGDFRNEMNEVYTRVGLNPWFKNYNMHNQFVQTLVELGLIGLVIYSFVYITAFIQAFRTRNFVLFFFCAGVVFFQLTEAVLERNKGIVFIVFFFLLLPKLKKLKIKTT